MPDPGRDSISDAFGMDGHNESDRGDHIHHTVYNDVTRLSWDEDKETGEVSGFHERLAPDTSAGHVWPDPDDWNS